MPMGRLPQFLSSLGGMKQSDSQASPAAPYPLLGQDAHPARELPEPPSRARVDIDAWHYSVGDAVPAPPLPVPGQASLGAAAAWIGGLLAAFIPLSVWRYRRNS